MSVKKRHTILHKVLQSVLHYVMLMPLKSLKCNLTVAVKDKYGNSRINKQTSSSSNI